MIISLDPNKHITGLQYKDGTRIGIINTIYEVPDLDQKSELFQKVKEQYPFYRYDISTNSYIYDEDWKVMADYSLTDDEIRARREEECFKYINRGELWQIMYANDLVRITQLREWYVAWLNAPISHIIPERPEWIK